MAAVPVLKPGEVVKTFEKLGWIVVRQRGSHIILTKQGSQTTIIFVDGLIGADYRDCKHLTDINKNPSIIFSTFLPN